MNRFYTAAGDDGYTSILDQGRVPKNDLIPQAVGAIDEANAALGLARSASQGELTKKTLIIIQGDLYHLMAEVSASPKNAARFRVINSDRVDWLETQVEDLTARVNVPKEFIVPGDTFSGATLDLARTVVRRAERQVAGLVHTGLVENKELLRYLNRLSSLCFVMELFENQLSGKLIPTFARDLSGK